MFLFKVLQKNPLGYNMINIKTKIWEENKQIQSSQPHTAQESGICCDIKVSAAEKNKSHSAFAEAVHLILNHSVVAAL